VHEEVRIVVVTQEEPFYLPTMLACVMREWETDVVAIMVLPGELSRRNAGRYLSLMGPRAFFLQVGLYLWYRLLNRIFPRGRSAGTFYSVEAVARRYGVRVFRPRNINDDEALEMLRSVGVDLLVSLSAPQIFREEVLSLPAYGCINVHNNLLPRYQGLLPSFWVLANGEAYTGTSVHYMERRVDSGALILQEKTAITESETVDSLIWRTKSIIGPRLLLDAISLIEKGDVDTIEVDDSVATYFSFPDKPAIQRFRQAGRRFR
jgi:methionyl-tRNA formyltransferase